jgi:hypothetical protein
MAACSKWLVAGLTSMEDVHRGLARRWEAGRCEARMTSEIRGSIALGTSAGSSIHGDERLENLIEIYLDPPRRMCGAKCTRVTQVADVVSATRFVDVRCC